MAAACVATLLVTQRAALISPGPAAAAAEGPREGDLEPLPGTGSAALNRDVIARVRPVWEELMALPRAQQLARINAMYAAALSCEGDAFEVLKGGPSQ
ncbi:hypothetical protein QA802_40345 [Streptomyces sp. B21-105]|uniref:hypothetical protein n=1 Tax=Streptomyces sp. B21-105 TaxID=3039417 RepID=UPI002FF21B2A